jgi:hypothetical protein
LLYDSRMRVGQPRELGFVAAQVVMELLPVWMVVTLLRHNAQQLLAAGFASCVLLQLSAAIATWQSQRWRLSVALRATLLAVFGAAMFWLWLQLASDLPATPQQPVFLWCLGLYLYVRGTFIGLHAGRPGAVLRWFRLGLALSVLLFSFLALSGTPVSELPFAALRGLCLAHCLWGAVLTGLDQRRAAAAAVSSAAWVAVLGPVLTILALASFVVFGPQGVRWLVYRAVSALLSAKQQLGAALHDFGAFFAELLRWLGSLFQHALGGGAPPAAPSGQPETWAPLVQLHPATWFTGNTHTLHVALLLIGAVLLAYLLMSWGRQSASTAAAPEQFPENEERGSTWSWQQLRDALRARLRVRTQRAHEPVVSSASGRDMRALFRSLLAWASARGLQRSASTTAHELAAQLAHQQPDKRDAIERLRAYYELERYAQRTASHAELEHARTLLDDVTRPTR